ncbi:beta-glucuronidase [Candidatus Sumerlaeota bacterium]|nr:beta-glucuronidase [Candidatus Sumerlaeota bacterium]
MNPAEQTHAAKLIGAIGSRAQLSLNGKWKYIIDGYETGAFGFMPVWKDAKPKSKSDRLEYSFDASPTLWVPGDWNSQDDKLFYYEGRIWHRRLFEIPEEMREQRLFLYFDAINYKAEVYFNNEKLGEHEGGFTPFNLEITGKLRDGENSLIVAVDNRRRGDAIPSNVTDWWNYGGITRDVRLVALDSTFIRNFHFQLAKGSANHASGWVELDGEKLPESVEVELPELGLKESFTVDDTGKARIELDLPGLQRWSPDNPKLYDVTIRAGESSVSDKIGFRTLETRGMELLLNGKPMFLRGVCYHEENAVRGGRAWSVEDAKRFLGYAKELNCNFVRLAHYPHNENIIRLADEWGILLWGELPLYWGIHWGDDQVLENAKRQMGEMINRDRNRAAVIIWSICNETGRTEPRNKFLKAMADHVRSLDDTRLVSAALQPDKIEGTGKKVISDALGEQLDVIALNQYIGWYDGLPDACKTSDYEVRFDKPLIISEFGAGALFGFHGDKETRWTEEFQAWVYRESFPMLERIANFRGCAPWVLVDFRTPLRMLPGIQDGWNRKGLVSERGERKQAFFIVQEYYRKRLE